MSSQRDKPLMRSLGEFFGHIVKAVKTDPTKQRTVVHKETQEEDKGDVVLRRTTIEEVEYRSHEDRDD